MSTIALSDKWSINVGPRGYDYELIETFDSINVKTKEPTVGTRKTYHPSLEQCISKLMKQESLSAIEAADNLKEVAEMLKEAERMVLEKINKGCT